MFLKGFQHLFLPIGTDIIYAVYHSAVSKNKTLF